MSELGQKLIAIVRRIAYENPDFVYEPPDGETCQYVHEETEQSHAMAGCLIGQALWEAGIIDSSLGGTKLNTCAFYDLVYELSLPIDSFERRWLRDVQFRQDKKRSWGMAVLATDAELLVS